jgi:putative hydrolase of the HAD superfamily
VSPTAIIFDLDDTLYLEVDYVRSGFRAVAAWASENLGVEQKAVETELNKLFDSGCKTDTFNRWLEQRENCSNLLPQMLDIYRNHRPQIQPMPDVIECLPSLAARYSIGLVSDGRAATQQLKWQALGLAGWFGGVVFSDTLGREHWKPHPLPFLTAAKQLGVEPRSCVYVGDNPAKDFVGARAAGMASVRIRRMHGLHYDVSTSTDDQADTEISDLSELSKTLASVANHIQ